MCVSSDVSRLLSEVQGVQGSSQSCIQVRAAESQTVYWAAQRVRAQLEELQEKKKSVLLNSKDAFKG